MIWFTNQLITLLSFCLACCSILTSTTVNCGTLVDVGVCANRGWNSAKHYDTTTGWLLILFLISSKSSTDDPNSWLFLRRIMAAVNHHLAVVVVALHLILLRCHHSFRLLHFGWALFWYSVFISAFFFLVGVPTVVIDTNERDDIDWCTWEQWSLSAILYHSASHYSSYE